MKKYLVIRYYKWDESFDVDNIIVCDSMPVARQNVRELINNEIDSLAEAGAVVIINANVISKNIFDQIAERTSELYILEDFNDSVILSQYGNSDNRIVEIIIKEIEA